LAASKEHHPSKAYHSREAKEANQDSGKVERENSKTSCEGLQKQPHMSRVDRSTFD
jgi:hypothetical protein